MTPPKHSSQQRHAFIAGSAHLDIAAVVEETEIEKAHPEVLAKSGSLHINFGGCSHNMAINLSALGVSSTLMTAVNHSMISQLILEELRQNNVRLHVEYLSDNKEAGFCGYLQNGDLISAVTSTPVSHVEFKESFIRKGMKNARCVVMDCNMTVATLDRIAALANDLGIPVFVAGVCEALAVKISEMTHPISYAFMNELEMNFLTRYLHCAGWAETAKKVGKPFIVTRGAAGASVCYPESGGGMEFALDKPVENPSNTLGSGDLFMSAVIHRHVFEGEQLATAIYSAFETTKMVLKTENANLGQVHLLESNMQEIYKKAHQDKLTGVLNRHGVERFLASSGVEKKNMAVLLIDADHFKKVNDTYGHDVGDEALVAIAAILKDKLRAWDIIGRLGGEEFICLLPDTELEVAGEIAERVREAVAAVPMTSKKITVTTSIGAGMWRDSHRFTLFLKHLDEALYKAKSEGRNRVVLAA